MAVSTIKDRIDRTKATHREEYTFPNSGSSVSNNNNKYTIQHDGICFIHYRFSDMQFSQFMCYINDISVTGPTYISNFNVGNMSGGIFSFPVHRGDVVSVSFYQSYTMSWINLNNLYVV